MYRSASWSRFSDGDEYYKHGLSPSTKESPSMQKLSASFESNGLPVYDPILELAKKERARVKFAENAVHVIPLVLLLCATILWVFSNPEVDVGIRGDSAAARIEGLTLDGEFDNDSDGTQTGALPRVDFGDMDSLKQLKDRKGPVKLAHRSFK